MVKPRREYVSLQDRAAQRTRAKQDLLARVRPDPGPVYHRYIKVTDEELARRQGRSIDEAWVRSLGAWALPTTLITNSTMPAAYTNMWPVYGSATTTMGTGWMGYYEPETFTTTFTTSAADEAYWRGWSTSYVETEEARAARELAEVDRAERLAALRRAEAERAAELAERGRQAERTARQLLLAHLDAQQKRDLLEYNWFEVTGSLGRRWRIRADHHIGNVDLMPAEGRNRMATYCAHSPERLPRSDHLLIQKIVLEADEAAFLAIANLHYVSPGVDLELVPDRRLRPAV